MSKPTRKSSKSKPKTATRRKLGRPMKGCEILVAALERENVDTIFAYPGGASMELHQALTQSKQIRTILPRHEQGGSFAAEGYARATGKAGVCMATSGPGATNLVTGIADAWMDSTPLVALTGQVPQAMIGKGAFQETDFYGMTLGIVKHSYLITDIRDIPRVVKEAFHIAQTGRPGPVVIDFPKNIQQQTAQPVWPTKIDLPGYRPNPKADDLELNEIIGLIEKAERPVLYVGGGIITGEASEELRAFSEATKIPVTTTIMGVGAFPEDHKLSLRWLGMHGAAYANWAVSGELRKDAKGNTRKIADGADLLLAFGVRFDDRVTNTVSKFCPGAKIIHVDIDPASIAKIVPVDIPIVGPVNTILEELDKQVALQMESAERALPDPDALTQWWQQIDSWREAHGLWHGRRYGESASIMPQDAICALYEATNGEAYVTSDVGQHQMFAAQYYKFDYPRRWINSGGLGTMGFGLPAAMGIKIALPDADVACVTGEGSIQMNIQELSTCSQYGCPVKIINLRNDYLGMVKQWQDMQYEGRYSESHYAASLPDFVKLAEAYGHVGMEVKSQSDLLPAMKEAFALKDKLVFMDIHIDPDEHVYPMMVAPNGAMKDMWLSKTERT